MNAQFELTDEGFETTKKVPNILSGTFMMKVGSDSSLEIQTLLAEEGKNVMKF